MRRSTGRILTTHTGSLPRPGELDQLMVKALAGEPQDPRKLAPLVRRSVFEVVRTQAEHGVDIVNDGEFSKVSYSTYVTARLDGFSGDSGPLTMADMADHPDALPKQVSGALAMVRPACTGPVSRNATADQAVATDITTLTEATQGIDDIDAFMTAVSPATIMMFLENRHYPNDESYLKALADAMRPEYKAIVDAGLTLQIDCPDLGCGHVLYGGASQEDVKRKLPLHIEVLNEALDGLPEDQMRLHVCWGNYDGPHHKDIELKEIIDTVLRARPAGLVLEAANPRHGHEWQVFEDVKLPEGKVLLPGVVDSTNNYVEHPDLIAQRLVTYANLVGRENVLAATDCGFGTSVGKRATAPSVAWAKLASMAEGAKRATARLW